jgi:hypothetical protein
MEGRKCFRADFEQGHRDSHSAWLNAKLKFFTYISVGMFSATYVEGKSVCVKLDLSKAMKTARRVGSVLVRARMPLSHLTATDTFFCRTLTLRHTA